MVLEAAYTSPMTWLFAVLLAQGGPPLLTDDPGTPGDGRWEVNLALTVEKSRNARIFEAPLLDLNYGVGERIQLKAELPWLVGHENGGDTQSALGRGLLGAKLRFLDQEPSGVDVSVYPQVEFGTSAHARRAGLADSDVTLLLPVEVGRDFGPLSVNVEAGYLGVEAGEDAWVWGVALGRQVAESVELLGEIHGESEVGFHAGVIVWNLGARIRLSELNTLLVSAGRGFRGESRSEPELIAYLGLQFNF